MFSCKKPTNNCEETMIPEPYDEICDLIYTDPDFDFILENYITFFPVEPTMTYDNYSYYEPVFNPNNSCEVAYIRKNNYEPTLQQEIWVFNMSTDESQMIADDIYSNLDWGSNGWLLYTGDGFQLYKVKANGDSLTQLTDQGGFNVAGKWNPSGTIAWYSNQGTQFIDVNGVGVMNDTEVIVSPIDWINDSTTLIVKNEKLYSQSFPSEIQTELNSTEVFSSGIGQFVIDRDNMNCYTTICPGDSICYYSKLDLIGLNSYDTINEWFSTRNYWDTDFNHLTDGGDFLNGRLILTFSELHRPDILVNEIYSRDHIVIMNPDGTDERMLLLP